MSQNGEGDEASLLSSSWFGWGIGGDGGLEANTSTKWGISY